MATKLVIFDCDGVLVDSEYLCSRIFAEVVTSFGYALSLAESIRRFTGVTAEAARQIIRHEAAVDLPEDYWLAKREVLFDTLQSELNGLMHPVLQQLELWQMARCVASNSDKDHILHCLEVTAQQPYFTEKAIFSAQQVVRGKPAPDLFLLAAEQMGVAPQECLVVEDSPIGVEAALAAGMPVVAFLGGRHAGYEWYVQQMAGYEVPLAHSCDELLAWMTARV
jgi:HAD superfamily hydrolase (TIGR01509 family)